MAREGWNGLQTLIRLDETVRGIANNYLKISALETCWYMRNQLLRDADWAGMAHSIENRVPLVDITLFRGIVPMLGKENAPTKRDFAAILAKPLPAAVYNRPKTGFLIPVREWIIDQDGPSGERGLRGWAKRIYRRF